MPRRVPGAKLPRRIGSVHAPDRDHRGRNRRGRVVSPLHRASLIQTDERSHHGGENDSILDAAKHLKVCGEDQRLQGMLTDRDIAVKVLAEGKDPAGYVPTAATPNGCHQKPMMGRRTWAARARAGARVPGRTLDRRCVTAAPP